MSEQAAQEPTMEEILASIRRIISEDETPASSEAETAAAPEGDPEAELEAAPVAEVIAEPEAQPEPVAAEPEAVAEPEAELAVEDDVLDLTEPMVASAEDSIGDLDVFTPAPPKAEARSMPAAAPAAPTTEEEPLVSGQAAAAAVSAFGQLASRVAMPPVNQTLDDVVRELLRPLLKDWLDQNLAAIVQAKVEEEVERLARRRGV
jgi:cell pole-organizing protein PopZ